MCMCVCVCVSTVRASRRGQRETREAGNEGKRHGGLRAALGLRVVCGIMGAMRICYNECG